MGGTTAPRTELPYDSTVDSGPPPSPRRTAVSRVAAPEAGCECGVRRRLFARDSSRRDRDGHRGSRARRGELREYRARRHRLARGGQSGSRTASLRRACRASRSIRLASQSRAPRRSIGTRRCPLSRWLGPSCATLSSTSQTARGPSTSAAIASPAPRWRARSFSHFPCRTDPHFAPIGESRSDSSPTARLPPRFPLPDSRFPIPENSATLHAVCRHLPGADAPVIRTLIKDSGCRHTLPGAVSP